MNAREVYRGYVDDARNTDNAWLETWAVHFHCPAELALLLSFDELSDVQASPIRMPSDSL